MKYTEIRTFIDRILREVERKHLHLVAAGLAFYFLTSLFPALVLLIAITAFFVQNSTEGATAFLGNVMPHQGVALIEQLLTSITAHRTGLLSFGIITTIWLASKGVKGIIAALDIVHEVKVPRRLWTNRIVAFGLTFTVGVLLLVGVVLTLAGPTIENLLSRVAPVHSLWIRAWPYIQWSISATFIFIAIELLYVIAPNVPRRGRVTVPGALVAASIWLLLSWGLEYYFHQVAGAKLDRFYGALASPIALMGWVYWSASAILIGAEINVHLQAQKNRREKVLQFESDAA